jgi:hypothetical protein
MDENTFDGDNSPMPRYAFPAFVPAKTPRYIVVWDLRLQVLDCQRIEATTDLYIAMASAIDRLAGDGYA